MGRYLLRQRGSVGRLDCGEGYITQLQLKATQAGHALQIRDERSFWKCAVRIPEGLGKLDKTR